MAKQITCANKPSGDLHDRHEEVSDYGWHDDVSNTNGIWDRQTMVDWVNAGNTAYVIGSDQRKAFCGVRGIYPRQYLQTYADGDWKDNIVSMPNCIVTYR